ncbi:MAG: hypothetical protein PWP65_261 [Clostridia bacterium]|nr:hypothetical protein [Clostridia bacterium]
MYVFYLGRRRLRSIAFFLLVLLFVLGLGLSFTRAQLNPVPVMKIEPIYQGNPNIKAVALTFNIDWGQEYLPKIEEALASAGVKATFFITGRWAEQFPGMVKELALAGHEIGNHGFSHAHVDQLSLEDNKREIERAEKILKELTGIKPNLYTPPYGENKPHVVAAAAQLGYKTIMWTVNPGDWMPERNGADIIRIVKQKAQNGAVILLHPTEKTAEVLPEIIRLLKEEGYGFKTVTEIL